MMQNGARCAAVRQTAALPGGCLYMMRLADTASGTGANLGRLPRFFRALACASLADVLKYADGV